MYVKYIYEGIPLREYCREHDISFSMVQSRMFRYKQKHPELSDNELVTYAMEEFKNRNYKYYYQGITLIDYCKKNNRSYQVVYGRILNKKYRRDGTPACIAAEILSLRYFLMLSHRFIIIPQKAEITSPAALRCRG